jgi:beta-aspartyl-peptidase (threonine type)
MKLSPPRAIPFLSLLLCLLLTLACGGADEPAAVDVAPAEPTPAEPTVEWALAIHGGAGVISKDLPEEQREAYRQALRDALELGRDLLAEGKSSLDVVEAVVAQLEDEPLFNAGRGAVFTHEGTNELDAAIMDGRDLSCGAVSGLRTVKNPIRLARKVMTDSKHVFFTGDGAEQFATEVGVERVDPEYFFTQRRYDAWQKALAAEEEKQGAEAEKHGTVGAVARDRDGNLAAATSTGGLTDKRFGRVGDVPVIGAGTYANNATAAISCTGWGEKFIKNTVAHDVSARMEYKGIGVEEAAGEVIHGRLDEGDGGLIAVSSTGSIAMVFNSPGMFRGAADSSGRFEVGIWEETGE